MFNIGPLELGVLVLIGLLVVGPDKLPGIIKDAVRTLRTVREMANGARSQLKNELGPEFADLNLDALNDLRSLNPRTALTRAILGTDDDAPAASASAAPAAATPEPAVELQKPPAQQPLSRGEKAPFDADAT